MFIEEVGPCQLLAELAGFAGGPDTAQWHAKRSSRADIQKCKSVGALSRNDALCLLVTRYNKWFVRVYIDSPQRNKELAGT